MGDLFRKWALVVALSMTPALIAGGSSAAAAGIAFGFDPVAIIAVVSVSSFVYGLIVVQLSKLARRVERIERFLKRFHRPRAIAFCDKYGPWGGLLIGVAFIGSEGILVTLTWMDVSLRKLLAPLAVSSILFAVIYYFIVKLGYAQAHHLDRTLEDFKYFWQDITS